MTTFYPALTFKAHNFWSFWHGLIKYTILHQCPSKVCLRVIWIQFLISYDDMMMRSRVLPDYFLNYLLSYFLHVYVYRMYIHLRTFTESLDFIRQIVYEIWGFSLSVISFQNIKHAKHCFQNRWSNLFRYGSTDRLKNLHDLLRYIMPAR